jgi:hypothetical protein
MPAREHVVPSPVVTLRLTVAPAELVADKVTAGAPYTRELEGEKVMLCEASGATMRVALSAGGTTPPEALYSTM